MTRSSTHRKVTPEQLWVALARCYRAVATRVENSVAQHGMNLTDFMLLEALLHKGPLTITQVQDAALLATGSMTAAVDRLETRGWIVRRPSPADRRARVLELTAAGSAAIGPVYGQHRSDIATWLDDLSEEERLHLFTLLRRVAKQGSTSAAAT